MTTKNIYIFSNSTGETGERIAKATLAQFETKHVRLYRKNFLRTLDDIRKALDKVNSNPGLILITLVDLNQVEFVRSEADRLGLKAIDLISPMIKEMQEFLAVPAKRKPGGIYKVDDEYFDRMEAVNYTVKHDDGQNVQDLHKADIVLVGVSRTSKTPLSMYLAGKGYKVANIPLVEEVSPPGELFRIDQDSVIGLTVDAQQLIRIRMSRMRNIRQPVRGRYTEYEWVESELAFAKRLYRQNPRWMIVDMTNKAIEEAAAEIMKKFQHR